MNRQRQLVKITRKIYRLYIKRPLSIFKKQLNWLLRTLFVNNKRRSNANAGFVLPTVAMVALVLVVLTAAILFRSFERAKNASNVRVNEIVLQANTPALDRAKAKLTALFSDPTLPRAIPSDTTLYKTFINKLGTYTFGDETSLIIGYDIDNDSKVETIDNGSLEEQETLQTGWKFPVDTDNDGKFDSFTLYGIYFRNPPYVGTDPTRKRTPLEARTTPISGSVCDSSGDTSASLVGGSSWYKVTTGELKKSFFIYAATVPITDISTLDNSIKSNYETYTGNRGFSAIEMQQDRKQIPLTNNAVVYEDDLEISPGPAFRMNGRLVTNSNFFTRGSSQTIKLFQVSSIQSCYYDRENGKILVGGNAGTNTAIESSDQGGVVLDLYKDNGITENQSINNKSTTNAPNQVAYNSQAYAQRIDFLVSTQMSRNKGNDPQVVKDNISRRIAKDPALDADAVRKQELETYFRQRTRRVPFNEVPLGRSALGTFTTANVLQGTDSTTDKSNDALRPPDAWIYPTNANTTLTLSTGQLPAVDPSKVDQSPVTEELIGDRIIVGNNLPELRWDSTKNGFVGDETPQTITGQNWNASSISSKSGTTTRTRTTRVKQLADLGVTARDGYWETSAASVRADVLDVLGGIRIITGAGVYGQPSVSNLPQRPTAPDNANTTDREDQAPVVWYDTMPMVVPDSTDPTNTSKQTRGDLVMRATAVYHYNQDPYNPQTVDLYQKPIACISSYYNPTSSATVADGYDPNDPTKAGLSNNGFSYKVPTTTADDVTRGLTTDTNGQFSTTSTAADVANSSVSLQERLKYQANLVFPNGQYVNPLLRQALRKATTQILTLSEQSALDSTICALQIADGTLTRDNTVVPNQAIRETAFLDARQVKTLDGVNTAFASLTSTSPIPSVPATQSQLTGNYDLAIEQRQPIEIRATVIDLDALRKKSITGTWSNEYLLPNSGIIYATRDDALTDNSGTTPNISATDYKLDPNRRPNAIMLINGSDLSRQTNYRAEEKGLILATDIPVYVEGDFNLHTRQEFTTTLDSTWSNFYTRTSSTRDTNFACRPNDPRLPKCSAGETWRPAAVISDAVSLLSTQFVEGFRNDGDFDLRNNRTDVTNASTVRINRLKNGFWDNNFVTSRNFTDSTYSGGSTVITPNPNSSYFNNFTTPVQRRVSFPEYVMEMCFKVDIAECGAGDWYVGYDTDNNNTITLSESLTKSSALPATANASQLVAGTTARAPKSGYERFPRRVAFRRNSSNQLLNATGTTVITFTLRTSDSSNVVTGISAPPVPLSIVSNVVNNTGTLATASNNSLWFTTVASTDTANPPTTRSYNNTTRLFYSFPPGADATYQPLLEPILQNQITNSTPGATTSYSNLQTGSTSASNTRWLSRAAATTFNLVIASGDTPIRVGNTTTPLYETNGSLHNFPRFLENWDGVATNITGSFIQFKRSVYATGPYQAVLRPTPAGNPNVNSLFSDRTGVSYQITSTPQGTAPYYMPPVRNWGFDVALLSQNPDLFAQRFVIPTTDAPDEFYREVSRDDSWVQTLLCAVQDTGATTGFDSGYNISNMTRQTSGGVTTTTLVSTKNTKYALPATQRPQCPVDPTKVN